MSRFVRGVIVGDFVGKLEQSKNQIETPRPAPSQTYFLRAEALFGALPTELSPTDLQPGLSCAACCFRHAVTLSGSMITDEQNLRESLMQRRCSSGVYAWLAVDIDNTDVTSTRVKPMARTVLDWVVRGALLITDRLLDHVVVEASLLA